MSPAPYLEAYRRQHGLNNLQLAQRIDYDPGNLHRLLRGKYQNVSVKSAVRIAKRLGVSVEVLMGVAED